MATRSRSYFEGWKLVGNCELYARMRSTSSRGIQANESLLMNTPSHEIQKDNFYEMVKITDLMVKDMLAFLRKVY